MTRELVVVKPENGLSKTIELLYKLSDKSCNNPEFVSFVKKMFSGDALAAARKIHNYLFTYIRYQQDAYEESITAPHLLGITKAGDCDDMALYAYTAMKILGHDTSMMILGEGDGFSHILTTCIYDGNLIVIDGTNSVFNVIPEKYDRLKYV